MSRAFFANIEAVPEALKQIRRNLGTLTRPLSQREFAIRLGCSESYIRNLEKGRQKPGPAFLERLNEFAGQTMKRIDEFLATPGGQQLIRQAHNLAAQEGNTRPLKRMEEELAQVKRRLEILERRGPTPQAMTPWPQDDDGWHKLLDRVLRSADPTAIQAVQMNLMTFVRLIEAEEKKRAASAPPKQKKA